MTDPSGAAQIPLAGPPVLDFSGSRSEGWPVSTPDGVVARMEVSFRSSEFTVRDVSGNPLCSGKIPFGSFGRQWEVVDAAGAPVLSFGVGWGRTMPPLRPHACRPVPSSTGSSALAHGFQRQPSGSGWRFRPDAQLVQQDGSLTLTQFVAIVQTHRRMVQRRRGAAAAANA